MVSRIGLRYINRIERESLIDKPGHWLVTNEYIPEGILLSEPDFLLRVETRLNTYNMLIITLGDTRPQTGSTYGAIIFDIDRIVEREIPDQQTILEEEMELLHTDVWNVFSSATGEKLKAYMREEGNG